MVAGLGLGKSHRSGRDCHSPPRSQSSTNLRRVGTVRLRDGRFECSDCGAFLELLLDEALRVVVYETNTRPNVRILALDRREIHRCTVGDDDLPGQMI